MIIIVVACAASLFYLAATAIQLRALKQNTEVPLNLLHGMLMPALCLHLVVLWLTVYASAHTDLRFYNALSLILFLISISVYAARARLDRMNVLLIFSPITAVVLILQALFRDTTPLHSSFDWQIQIHIAVAVIAFVLLAIATAQALLLSLQQRALKSGHSGRLFSWFPPLDRMESLLFGLIAVGFIALTLTLLSGILFVENLLAQHLLHKTVLSMMAWILFGWLLIGHLKFGWRGQKATRLTLIAMGLLLLAYFGSKLVLELILGR